MFGAWRNFAGGTQEGVVVQTSNVEQSGGNVDQGKAEVVPYAAQTALSTPLNADGTYVSVYGEDATAYLTPDDVALGLQEDHGGLPAQRSTVLVDDPIPSYTDADGYIHVIDSEPADVSVSQRIDAEPAVTEQEGGAPGPLQPVAGHDHSEIEQANASRWQAKIVQRTGEVVRQLGWEASDEHVQALGEAIATELLLDYTDLVRMMVETDRAQRHEARAELQAELGDEFPAFIEAVDNHLMDQNVFPYPLGEILVESRTRSGQRLFNIPHMLKYFYLARAAFQGGEHAEAGTVDENAELEEILKLQNSDIDAHHRERRWGPNRDMTGAERAYQILKSRELAA
jgi:hypothetical protein